MIEVWYTALDAQYGLRIRTDDRDRLKMLLYAVRAKAQDIALDALAIVCPAHEPDQLWLIRKSDGEA
jgi:hypothetical protein